MQIYKTFHFPFQTIPIPVLYLYSPLLQYYFLVSLFLHLSFHLANCHYFVSIFWNFLYIVFLTWRNSITRSFTRMFNLQNFRCSHFLLPGHYNLSHTLQPGHENTTLKNHAVQSGWILLNSEFNPNSGYLKKLPAAESWTVCVEICLKA